jgi:hypothetical protein
MSWQVTGKQKFPAVIGEPFGGGFFAGYISHTADGNPTHALIVAPRADGATGGGYTLTTNPKWADETVDVPAHATLIGASSNFDGKANTDLMMSLIADSTYSAGAFPLLNSALISALAATPTGTCLLATSWTLLTSTSSQALRPTIQIGEATFTQFPKETTTTPQTTLSRPM